MIVKPLYWALALLTVVGLIHAGGAEARRAADRRPNIVFVLTDDLAWNLVQYMPHVEQLRALGTTFTNYFVTDSLCCPSRASMFTGRYPHDTGIFTNGGADGGVGPRGRGGGVGAAGAAVVEGRGASRSSGGSQRSRRTRPTRRRREARRTSPGCRLPARRPSTRQACRTSRPGCGTTPCSLPSRSARSTPTTSCAPRRWRRSTI